MLRRSRLPLLTLAVGLALAPQAGAQATRTWVSGVGDDANPCSRTAPCKTLAGTISKTAEYGEINAIDPGGFGAVTITKSITIDLLSTEGGVLNTSGTNGVNVVAGADDVVVLRGLDIHGAPIAPAACVNPGSGVRIVGAGKVRIEDSRIDQQQRAIWAQPTSAVDLLVNRVEMANNCAGGVALEPGAGGSVRATIVNSSISNSGTALRAAGGATAWLGNTLVTGNALGLETAADGAITDWGDNRFSANTTDGVATTRLGLAVPRSGRPAGARPREARPQRPRALRHHRRGHRPAHDHAQRQGGRDAGQEARRRRQLDHLERPQRRPQGAQGRLPPDPRRDRRRPQRDRGGQAPPPLVGATRRAAHGRHAVKQNWVTVA